MRVRTSVGVSDQFTIGENVLQGSSWGPIMASNQIDKFGKQCLEQDRHIYMYRNLIPIVPLSLSDDLLSISECGYDTNLMPLYINSQSKFHYLQFGMDKCFKIHVGRKKEKYKCSPVSLDYWKLEETENKDTGEVFLQEEYQGKKEIKEVSHE